MKQTEKEALVKAVKTQAIEHELEFWHDMERVAWATVPVKGCRENWLISSRDFRLWVTDTLFGILNAPPPKALVKAAIEEFETWAVCRCPKHQTYIRLARPNDELVIDLANPSRQAARITGEKVVIEESNLKFIRPKGMDALPLPAAPASDNNLDKLLLDRLNLRPDHRLLFLAWLTNCLRPSGPYPLLVLSGVQGCGKSTLTRIVRMLIDPNIAKLTSLSRTSRDLAIAASKTHLLAFDNVSKLTTEMSDDFCRMATGGAFRTRKLYTDEDEQIFRFCKPLIINGIENLILRSDLLDRSLLIHMEPIKTGQRRTEEDFWTQFEEIYPIVLGALYSAVGKAYDYLPFTDDIEQKPRMADFARWGMAVEQVLRYPEGRFLKEYALNREEANALALEASPVAMLVHDYLLQHGKFFGTHRTLLQELVKFAEAQNHHKQKGVLKHPEFPKSPSALSAAIARVEPNLQNMNIEICRSRSGNNKLITLNMQEAV
jgi:putative DNA primase/helicase